MVKQWTRLMAAMLVLGPGIVWAQHAGAPAKAAAQPVFVADAAAERIENIDKLKAELKQYHDCTCPCGCYAHDLDRQADLAIAFLHRRMAHPRSGEKPAMVLDIDETTLSNYEQMVGADFTFNQIAFNAWVDSAKAPAIAGTLRLYKEAQRLGVKIFFITGRPETERTVTERNLRAQGFDGWRRMDLRPSPHGRGSVGLYKSAMRKRIVEDGYTLVLNVGDQWSDLRGAPEAEFNVKYPDPFYYLP
jgi:acid phosphatase